MTTKTYENQVQASSLVKSHPVFLHWWHWSFSFFVVLSFFFVRNSQGTVQKVVTQGYNIQGSYKIRTIKRSDGAIEYPYGSEAPTYLTFEPDGPSMGSKKPSKDKDKGRWGLGTLGNKDKEPVVHGRYEATDDPNIYILYDAKQKKFAILHTAYMEANHQGGSVWLLQEDGKTFEYVPESKAISANLLL